MEEMKLRLRKNIIPWLKDQLSRPSWFRNFFITRNAWAAFSVNSHIRRSNGESKVAYPTKDVAQKAAEKMGNKYGVHFSVYKCLYCVTLHKCIHESGIDNLQTQSGRNRLREAVVPQDAIEEMVGKMRLPELHEANKVEWICQ